MALVAVDAALARRWHFECGACAVLLPLLEVLVQPLPAQPKRIQVPRNEVTRIVAGNTRTRIAIRVQRDIQVEEWRLPPDKTRPQRGKRLFELMPWAGGDRDRRAHLAQITLRRGVFVRCFTRSRVNKRFEELALNTVQKRKILDQ